MNIVPSMRLLLVALISTAALAAEKQPAPILAVLEQNPWMSVIGSDSPVLAVYEDGTVIAVREKPTPRDPFTSRRVKDGTQFVAELLSFDPANMSDYYSLSDATDQVSTVIWTKKKRIVIYGSWREPLKFGNAADPEMKRINSSERQLWERLPKEIRAALIRVDHERSVGGTSWLPEEIEVMFWDYDYAPEQSSVWPKEWPDLNASDTRRRGKDFSVFLPAKLLGDLQQFLATRRQKGAVLVSGKKMAAAYRFPFPGEQAWMR